jgi:hypothetical protein
VVLLAALWFIGLLAVAPGAGAFIYWAGENSIGRAANDGAGATPSFIKLPGQQPCGVAVDSQHVYWANVAAGSIGRANLDGSGANPSFITAGVGLVCGVTLEGNHIWWANLATSPTDTGSVGRANLDGSGGAVVYSTSTFVEGPAQGVGVGSNLVFWTNNDPDDPTIGRAGVDGTPPPNKSFLTLSDGFRPVSWPTVGEGRLYFASTLGLFSTNLEGGVPASLIGTNASGGIALYGGQVYWANFTEGTMSRANLALGSPNFAFLTGLGNPSGIAVDGGSPAPASQPPQAKKKKCKKKKKKRATAAKKKKCKKKRRK